MKPEQECEAELSGLLVRSVQTGDGPEIVSLLNQVFGNWGNLDDWMWKYHTSPIPYRIDSFLAEHHGKIIGHYGMLPLEMMSGGKTIQAAQAVDAGVLAEYRGCGIFTTMALEALTKAVNSGVEFIYAFPGLLSLNVNLHLGYRTVGFVPEMVRVLDFNRALTMTLSNLSRDLSAWWVMRRRGISTPELVRRLVRLRRSLLFFVSFLTSPNFNRLKLNQKLNVVIHKVERIDSRIDSLWEQVRGTTDIGLNKASGYLNWRYNCHPSQKYQVFVADGGKNWAGCLVMRHTGLRSEIVELLVNPERVDLVSDLLSTAISEAHRVGSIAINMWATNKHISYSVLHQHGFISSDRLFRLADHFSALAQNFYQVIVYLGHLSLEQQSRLYGLTELWQLSMGDSDLA